MAVARDASGCRRGPVPPRRSAALCGRPAVGRNLATWESGQTPAATRIRPPRQATPPSRRRAGVREWLGCGSVWEPAPQPGSRHSQRPAWEPAAAGRRSLRAAGQRSSWPSRPRPPLFFGRHWLLTSAGAEPGLSGRFTQGLPEPGAVGKFFPSSLTRASFGESNFSTENKIRLPPSRKKEKKKKSSPRDSVYYMSWEGWRTGALN